MQVNAQPDLRELSKKMNDVQGSVVLTDMLKLLFSEQAVVEETLQALLRTNTDMVFHFISGNLTSLKFSQDTN